MQLLFGGHKHLSKVPAQIRAIHNEGTRFNLFSNHALPHNNHSEGDDDDDASDSDQSWRNACIFTRHLGVFLDIFLLVRLVASLCIVGSSHRHGVGFYFFLICGDLGHFGPWAAVCVVLLITLLDHSRLALELGSRSHILI